MNKSQRNEWIRQRAAESRAREAEEQAVAREQELEEKRLAMSVEQLESFVAALGLPILPEGMRPPYYRDSLLNLHRLTQKALDGDIVAEARLDGLRARFGRAA